MQKIYRYKTSYLPASTKKLKAVSWQLKGLKIDNAIDLSSFSKKAFSKIITKDFLSIKYNLKNIIGLKENEIKMLFINKIFIEKKIKFFGRRFKARGHASSSKKQICVLNIYFMKEIKELN